MLFFVHNPLATNNKEDTFLPDFLNIGKNDSEFLEDLEEMFSPRRTISVIRLLVGSHDNELLDVK